MSVLVVGGAGYIGSHTVYALLDAGYEVVVVDNLSTGFRAAVPAKARFYEADIRDREAIGKVLAAEHIDSVIHFAACSQVGESMQEPLKYYENNVYGTMVLLGVMLEHGVTNIVFSSTAATYGEPETVPIPESAATNPTNCYGATKLAMEQMMRWTAHASDLRYVALRYFNACGAHASGEIGEAHDPETHLIPVILQAAQGKRDKISIFGEDYDTPDGTCIRDYIHVSDLAQAHVLAMEYLAKGNESDVFNLGNGTGFSVKEVVEMARQVTGCDIPAEISPRRAGDPARLVASSDKTKAVLGWQPQYADLSVIIESAWQWHRSHPNGFEG